MIFELGLRELTSRTTFACRNTDVFQPEPRDCIRALLFYLKVAVLEPEPWECTLRTTLVLNKVTICHPELRECSSRAACILETRECTWRTTFVPKTYEFAARTAGAQFPRNTFVLENAILEPKPWECASRTTFVLNTCGFRARAAGALFVHYSCV